MSFKLDTIDNFNNLDSSYWVYLTESISKKVDTWILRNGGLTSY